MLQLFLFCFVVRVGLFVLDCWSCWTVVRVGLVLIVLINLALLFVLDCWLFVNQALLVVC